MHSCGGYSKRHRDTALVFVSSSDLWEMLLANADHPVFCAIDMLIFSCKFHALTGVYLLSLARKKYGMIGEIRIGYLDICWRRYATDEWFLGCPVSIATTVGNGAHRDEGLGLVEIAEFLLAHSMRTGLRLIITASALSSLSLAILFVYRSWGVRKPLLRDKILVGNVAGCFFFSVAVIVLAWVIALWQTIVFRAAIPVAKGFSDVSMDVRKGRLAEFIGLLNTFVMLLPALWRKHRCYPSRANSGGAPRRQAGRWVWSTSSSTASSSFDDTS
ncbi:hypothetical protein DL764_004083 [Monosporascus ibericus]|uniref:Uncharacterized protein n=1 Tax=Monosporascus ibericus TaxID=155417 RepID=A0A4Q4TEN5_9PEZI|nr:hypothetical protein DL764_004083 [Monosporascus ibericus]